MTSNLSFVREESRHTSKKKQESTKRLFFWWSKWWIVFFLVHPFTTFFPRTMISCVCVWSKDMLIPCFHTIEHSIRRDKNCNFVINLKCRWPLLFCVIFYLLHLKKCNFDIMNTYKLINQTHGPWTSGYQEKSRFQGISKHCFLL